MRWIRRLLVATGLLVLAAVLGLVVHGPLGPLAAGPLFGDVVDERIDDWSFTDAHAEIQVQTRIGFLPYSVTTWCLSHEGLLYVPSRNGGQKRWVQRIMEDPNAWIRVGGKTYPVRFRRITDMENGRPLRRLMLAKYLGIEADVVRGVSGPSPTGEPRAEIWTFVVESRDG